MKRALNLLGWFLLCLGGFLMGIFGGQESDLGTGLAGFGLAVLLVFIGILILGGGEK